MHEAWAPLDQSDEFEPRDLDEARPDAQIERSGEAIDVDTCPISRKLIKKRAASERVRLRCNRRWRSSARSRDSHRFSPLRKGAANAAELLKHTWDGWPQRDQAQFETMLRDTFYPVIKDFYPSANGNWDASMLQCETDGGRCMDFATTCRAF